MKIKCIIFSKASIFDFLAIKELFHKLTCVKFSWNQKPYSCYIHVGAYFEAVINPAFSLWVVYRIMGIFPG
jgi:hypothetical protein